MDVSIIIPTHNRLWSLPRCINSISSESLNLEIIVIDDGSDDGTWEWLQQQSNIISFRQEKWGKPWAVNKAFSIAKGKYIKFLDSDDWIISGALDGQFKIAETTNCDLVVAGFDIYQDESYQTTVSWTVCDDFIAQQLGECDSSHYSAFLFKKTFINDIPHRTSYASADFASKDDRCFMLEVALKKPYFEIYNNSALAHRHHKNDRLQFRASLKGTCSNLQLWLIYKNIINQLKNANELTERRLSAAIKILWPLAHWIAKHSLSVSKEIIDFIYQHNPKFKPENKGLIGVLYRYFGFIATEKILNIRRAIFTSNGK